MMQDTYTYIARSAEDPSQVAIFTLYDHAMTIEPGASVEALEATLRAITGGEEATLPRPRVQRLPWFKPVVAWLLGRGVRPFRVVDTQASAKDGGLSVTTWLRAGGLRLLPVTFHWEHVDNREMARAFVEELQRRKATTIQPTVMRGALGYWFTWITAGLTLGIGLYLWLGQKRSSRRLL